LGAVALKVVKAEVVMPSYIGLISLT